MDISDTLAPNSDQLDAIELVAGPRIFTITSVTKNAGDQPIDVHLAEFPRPWRPGKSMRRVLAACWGTDARLWVGRRVELFFDPEVTFGKDKPGGTRISRLSDIPKRKPIPLLVARGKSAMYVVDPLPNEAPRPSGMDEFNPETTTWRDPGPLITPAQSKQLFAALNDAGLGDKAAALTFISGQIGREIETSKELTMDEAPRVIAALAAITDPAITDAPTLDGSPA